MAAKYSVLWSKEANLQVERIFNFIKENWSDKEAENFLDLLFHFEKTIALFPNSFKTSKKFKDCRLGLVHKHVTAIYKIDGNQIIVLTIFDNRSKIKK